MDFTCNENDRCTLYIFNDVKLVNWKEFKALYFFQ